MSGLSTVVEVPLSLVAQPGVAKFIFHLVGVLRSPLQNHIVLPLKKPSVSFPHFS